MRRTDTEGDDEAQGPCGAHFPAVSRSAAGETVIPFRRADRAASGRSAAGGEPPSPPASFVSLGSATAAVVMRLSKQFPRFKMLTQTTREEET
jgi:hypothetical protein